VTGAVPVELFVSVVGNAGAVTLSKVSEKSKDPRPPGGLMAVRKIFLFDVIHAA